jgi:catechol 2,3-dioxygenase-like lactoylglutathione lyase family enzyme
MLTGAHAILYAKDADRTRAFFRDVLGFRHVDAGDGWLIFALPPAEMGIHPAEESGRHELYLTCDDVAKTVKDLEAKGVRFTQPIADQGWGLLTVMEIPGGGSLGLYQPRHPMAAEAPKKARARTAKRASRPKGKAKTARQTSAKRRSAARGRSR